MNKNDKTNTEVLWKILKEKKVFAAHPWLSVSVQCLELPNGKILEDYYQVHFPEAAVIVARTRDGRVVLSRQYQHGFAAVSLVLPAGTVGSGESPLQVAKRELMEETGYFSDEWYPLGGYIPHNNYGCGRIHFFFADGARKISEPESKDFEAMETILMSLQEIDEAIRKREIIALGSIAALSLAKTILNKTFS